jgi:uncharacterized protein YqhQ
MRDKRGVISRIGFMADAFARIAGIAQLWTEEPERTIPVGGQAVIEGVLMKGPEHWGLVVREPDGSLWSKAWLGSDWLKRGAWKWPVIRGFASMVEMMKVGMKALSLSAERALGEEESFSIPELILSIGVAILMVVGLFIALPVWLSDLLANETGASFIVKNLAEGIIRCTVFVLYVAAVGALKDIRRVFSYHGAEHKTINAYENKLPLSPESVAGCSRIHRRCGTSFMLVVVAVSIFVFSFFSSGPFWLKASARVVLLPLVIGLSYEVIRGASKSETWGKYLIMPALSLQYLTTREPDFSMLEVAIKSLDIALNPYAVLDDVSQGGEACEKSDEVNDDGILGQA